MRKLFLLLSMLLAAPAGAAVITLDFEGLSGPVDAHYAGLGVTFANARARPGIYAGSSGNTIIDHVSLNSYPSQADPIRAFFSAPVDYVSLVGLDVGINGFILKAFDASGALLDSRQVINTMSKSGVGYFYKLEIATPGIRSVAFSLVRNIHPDGIVFDLFAFRPAAAPAGGVPEPAPLGLLGLGLAGLGWLRRRAA